VKNLHLNLDRRTGYAKGYAFIEYENQAEADAAIQGMNDGTFMDRKIKVDYAFKKPAESKNE